MGEPADELDAWDFDDAMLVTSTRAGGGFLQTEDGQEPVIYIEHRGDTGVCRIILAVDQLLDAIVRMEHAGKTAMLMEHVLPR